MNKKIFIILAAVVLTLIGFSRSEATTVSVASPFPSPEQYADQTWTLAGTDLNVTDHAVIFFNNFSNTAVAVVLDSLGNPDDSLLGNAFMAADFSTNSTWYASGTTTSVTSPYPAQAPDQITVIPSGQLNNIDTGVIFVNNAAKTAMAVVVDANGVPDDSLVGYAFLAADLNTGSIWGTKYSHILGAWYCISNCPQ
jgi:hypothetical protein